MVSTFLKVYIELGSYFVSARTNKGHHHLIFLEIFTPPTYKNMQAAFSSRSRKLARTVVIFLFLQEQIKGIISWNTPHHLCRKLESLLRQLRR